MGPFFDNRADIICEVLARGRLVNIGIRPSAISIKMKRVVSQETRVSFPHHKLDEQPNKKPKKGYYSQRRRGSDDKNAVAIVKIVPQLGCVSQDSETSGVPKSVSRGQSVRTMGKHTTGPAVENHISPKMARKSISKFRTTYHSLSLVCQRVLPQLHLHLLLHHLHNRIPYLMSTDTSKIQYQKEVEVRAQSFGKTRCMKPQKPTPPPPLHPKGNPKKYKEIYRMNDLIGCRNSVRIWLMKVQQQSRGETQSKEVRHFQVVS